MRVSNKGSIVVISILLSLMCFVSRGQFWDSSTGLLQMPSADMNRDGTVMFTGNLLNKHSISDWYWGYNTFQYGINVNFWSRVEIGYVCVILDGKRKENPSERDLIMINQDRHFNAKVLLTKEGEFGVNWLPAIAVGISDPTTHNGNDYIDQDVSGEGNGFFNRYYAVATKHFDTKVGTIGAHLGYQYNIRTDFPMNGPCAAIDWMPIWLQREDVVKTKLIAEYDSRTFNIGAIISLWKDHIDAMFELMDLKWINAGIRYKFVLK